MPPAFHAITTGLLNGLLFFALLAVIVRIVLQWQDRDPRSPLAVAADQTALWAVVVGLVMSLAAIITGFTIWAPSAAINSPVMRNKLLTAALLVVTYAIFIGIRWTLGQDVWRSKVVSAFYGMVALAGFHWSMVTSSIGGDIAGIPSGYETIVRLSGVETRFTYYLPTWTLVVIAVVSVAMLVVALTDKESATTSADRPDAPARS